MARRGKSKRRYSSAAARAKQAAAVAGPGGGGGTMFQNIPSETNYYNPEEGKTTLRFLPYVVTDPKHPDGEMAPADDIWYKRPFKRFRQIGVDKKPYISPRSIGKPCPVSEYYTAAKADPGIPDKEADRAKPQDCVMYNVQEIDRKGNISEPMFFWTSYHKFEKQLKKELLDPDNEDYLTFMDLEGGFDLRIRWEKETFAGNDFVVAGNITFIERDEDIDEDILDQVVNLDECLVVKGYDELKNVFLEIDEDPEDPDEQESEKKSGGRSNRNKKTAEPDKKKETTRGSRGKKEEPPEDECPHGYDFGEDFDAKRKCGRCKVADNCEEAFEKSNPSGDDDKGEGDSGDCPHDYVFGTDNDKKKECDACDKWDDCMDELERLEKDEK